MPDPASERTRASCRQVPARLFSTGTSLFQSQAWCPPLTPCVSLPALSPYHQRTLRGEWVPHHSCCLSDKLQISDPPLGSSLVQINRSFLVLPLLFLFFFKLGHVLPFPKAAPPCSAPSGLLCLCSSQRGDGACTCPPRCLSRVCGRALRLG